MAVLVAVAVAVVAVLVALEYLGKEMMAVTVPRATTIWVAAAVQALLVVTEAQVVRATAALA
jgi:hypothetical protein